MFQVEGRLFGCAFLLAVWVFAVVLGFGEFLDELFVFFDFVV
jgi:hypothetical protein